MTAPSVVDRLNTALAGRYRIERELGAGGMATVYLAADLRHDRKVAIKVLKPELAAVLGAERFVVEIRTTASLSHPHVLPLFDSGTADGFLFYVMPYIAGETIREKLNRESQFGVDEAVRITREVADALDYAHRHGVIHRDIKPENVLLHDGRAMVMDFGIALAVSAAAGGRMTETGLSLGTPHYMSPEQATAEKEITPRSDVYSLASVLYEMLAGQPPHIGGSAQQVIMKIITESAQPVTTLRKSVPDHVSVALAKALEKLPADRFESARAFSDALSNPAFASTQATTRVFAGERRTSRTAFIAMTAVAAVASFAAIRGWTRPSPPRDITRLSVFIPDSQAMVHDVSAHRVAISPDGRSIVFAGAGPTTGGMLWLRSLDQLRPTPIPGTQYGRNPSFSPNGEDIVFISTFGKRVLKRVSLRAGPPQTLTDSVVDLGGTTWSDDGYIYFDGHLEGDGIARVRETGGAPEVATMPDRDAGEIYHMHPHALPGGRGLLFTIARGGANFSSWQIGVLDVGTGTHKVLTRGVRAWYSPTGHLIYATHAGGLMAARFDLGALEMRSDPVPLADGIGVLGNARVDLGLSNDGTLVYAAGRATSLLLRELIWVTRDGTVAPIDTSWVAQFSGRPALSPDGRSVAITVGATDSRQIWVKQLDRGPVSRVADDGALPSWSGDGRFLLYFGPTSIARVPADGSTLPVDVRRLPGGAASAPVYTDDGKRIVFTWTGDIYMARVDGDSTAQSLVSDPGTQGWPTVSPDGKWLAYASDEGGTFNIYVRPFPNTSVARRQVSLAGGMFPAWSRDGGELFYIEPTSGDLVSAPVIPGAAFATDVPTRLFSVREFGLSVSAPFDVAPDGHRFLFMRAIGAARDEEQEIVIVQNFFEELKARAR